jgi:hypothetical protein
MNIDGKSFIRRALLNGKEISVYSRERHHKVYGEPIDNWWAKISEDSQEDQWAIWPRRLANGPCWGVNIQQGNYFAPTVNETPVITGYCEVTITCNGEKVYGFCVEELYKAFMLSQHAIHQMSDHWFDFSEPDMMIGQCIRYKNKLAQIEKYLDCGDLILTQDRNEIRVNIFSDFIELPE